MTLYSGDNFTMLNFWLVHMRVRNWILYIGALKLAGPQSIPFHRPTLLISWILSIGMVLIADEYALSVIGAMGIQSVQPYRYRVRKILKNDVELRVIPPL
jgi:hypothetical protein